MLETQITADDVTRDTTDRFRRLMKEDEETDTIPTENPTDAKATNEDQQTPKTRRSKLESITDLDGITTILWTSFFTPWRTRSSTP